MDWLEGQPSCSPHWQWLTLTTDSVATNLYFKHCMQEPRHLQAAVLQGSDIYLDNLKNCFPVAALAEQASRAVEQILSVDVSWQPSIKDAHTGEPVTNSPLQPVMPVDFKAPGAPLIQGKPRTAINLADWLLNQPSALQQIGWLSLGQCLGKVIPDLSHHWVHDQWQFLQMNISVPEVEYEV
jgi:hypothetical protein